MAKVKKQSKMREFFESRGVDTSVFDKPEPSVSDVIQDQDSPFDYIGEDAAMAKSEMHVCTVYSPGDIDRVKRKGGTILADHREGSNTMLDINQRGGDTQGVVMGIPHKVQAVRKAAQTKRINERRTRKKAKTRESFTEGKHTGRLVHETDYSHASVRDN